MAGLACLEAFTFLGSLGESVGIAKDFLLGRFGREALWT
jgi:hypothetical protein